MNALSTHLDELLAVLGASARLRPSAGTPVRLRDQLVARLAHSDPDLAERLRGLDDWHAETLADFVAEAHLLAKALTRPVGGSTVADETHID